MKFNALLERQQQKPKHSICQLQEQSCFLAQNPFLRHVGEKRICKIALFVPNSSVILTLLKHLALLVVNDHDETLAVTYLSAILLQAH